jgi:Ulp1 family protease
MDYETKPKWGPSITKQTQIEVPHQANGVDCGVWVALYMYAMCKTGAVNPERTSRMIFKWAKNKDAPTVARQFRKFLVRCFMTTPKTTASREPEPDSAIEI